MFVLAGHFVEHRDLGRVGTLTLGYHQGDASLCAVVVRAFGVGFVSIHSQHDPQANPVPPEVVTELVQATSPQELYGRALALGGRPV